MGRLTEFLAPPSRRKLAFLTQAPRRRRGRTFRRTGKGGAVDISILGDRALSATFRKLPIAVQTKVARGALRRSIKRIHPVILQHLSGIPLAPDTGRYLIAMAGQKARLIRRVGFTGYTIEMPTRGDLGIAPNDQWYHPAVSEYGSDKDKDRYPEFMPIRRAVNSVERKERAKIWFDIKRGIPREARRLFRKAAGLKLVRGTLVPKAA